jgi:hypothetical protein
VRWSKSESSGIEEGHSGEGLAGMCVKAPVWFWLIDETLSANLML